MEPEPEEVEIKGKSQVVADGDVTDEKIQALIELDLEEAALDYKETLECDKARRKESACELVANLVSMANTDGGYIIVGMHDNHNSTWTKVGVDAAVTELYTDEHINNLLGKYVDGKLKIIVTSTVLGGDTILAICVLRSLIPVTFKCDGNYQQADGKPGVKFHEGEYLVRHGSKSERANREDWHRFVERIRDDERQVGLRSQGRHREVIDRLDLVVTLLGGEPPAMLSLDLFESAGEEVEDRVFRLQGVQNSRYLLRSLKREFKSINELIKEKCAEEEDEQLIEILDRFFVSFIRNLVPIWVVAIESDDLKLAEAIVDGLFDMYVRAASLEFKTRRGVGSIWLQQRILYIAYCLGAWATRENQPDFAKLLLGKGSPFEYSKPDESWYRFVLTELARADQLENQSLCSAVADFLEEDAYVMALFEGKDEAITYLCQFDFLQCAFTLMQTGNYHDCYPSFGAFKKPRTEPLIIRLIQSPDNTWLDGLTPQVLAKVIAKLDWYAGKEFVRFAGWTRGIWHDRRITEFMDDFKDEAKLEQ